MNISLDAQEYSQNKRSWFSRHSIVSSFAVLALLTVFTGCSYTDTEGTQDASTPDDATEKKTALLVIDVQNDFVPGGALAVTEGDQIIPTINQLQSKFDLVVATQDWHPADHSSFISNGPEGIWPDHCVQETSGAEFVDELNMEKIAQVVRKGTNTAVDSYSGFFDNDHNTSTGLNDYLHDNGITDVYIVGLATDYCVKYTALDAITEGFTTTTIIDATRGVEVNPGDVENAIKEMEDAGVAIVESSEFLN